MLDGKANARHDSSVEIGAGALLDFETVEREVVVRDNGAACIVGVARGSSEVGSCTSATVGNLVFGASVPIHITCDQIKGAKWVQGSELHLGYIIETFKPRRISDTREGNSVGVHGDEVDKRPLVIGVGLKGMEEYGDVVLILVAKSAKNEVVFG